MLKLVDSDGVPWDLLPVKVVPTGQKAYFYT